MQFVNNDAIVTQRLGGQIPVETTTFAESQVEARATSRLFFLDHLSVSLVILVVLHHVALVYGVF